MVMEKDAQSAPTSLNGAGDNPPMDPLHPVDTNVGRPACFRSGLHEILFVLTVTMAIAMGALFAGSATVTSSFVGRDLNMTTAEITWISSANSLSSGAFLLFFGKIADLFGRKTLFIGSLFFFSVFALAAGFAKSPITLDVLSGVMGLACASAVPPAVGLLGIIYEKPSKRKNYAFACFSAGNPLGFAFGTLFGGIATNLFGWRASFWLMAIIFLAFTIIGIWTIPRDFTPKEPLNWETLKRFDVLGTVAIIFGIGMFSAALSLGETAPQGWKTGYVLALLIVGVLLLVFFVLWDSWFKYPLVPMGIWKDRNFSLCLAILVLGFMSFTPGAFFIALYFQDVWGDSALETALRLLPLALMGLVVNTFAGLVLHRISNKLLMLIATLSYSAAFLLLAVNRHNTSYWALCFPRLPPPSHRRRHRVQRGEHSVAGGIFQTMAKLAQTLGFGIATAVFSAVKQNPRMSNFWDPVTQPYSAALWMATACSLFSVCLVPFLTLGTQGGKQKSSRAADAEESDVVETVPVGGEKKAMAEAMAAQASPTSQPNPV